MDFQTESDSLIETLLSGGHLINDIGPDQYPLIYFDAVHVVLRQLVRLCEQKNDDVSRRKLQEKLVSLAFQYLSFANAAIRAENGNGAALAIIRVKQAYQLFEESGLNSVADDTIEALLEFGGNAAGLADHIRSEISFGKSIPDYVIEIIEGATHRGRLRAAAGEVLIKGEGPLDKRMTFLKKLGKRLQSNFGLNFDWETGEALPHRTDQA